MKNILCLQDVTVHSKKLRRWLWSAHKISLVVLAWLGGLGIIYCLYIGLFELNLFTVNKIEVTGPLVHITKDEVLQLAKIDPGQNLFKVSLTHVRNRILTNPWVSEAAVTRKLPNTIWMYVGEYQPAAILVKNGLKYVDENLNIFKDVEAGDDKNFPVFSGDVDRFLAQSIDLKRLYEGSSLSLYFPLAEINSTPEQGFSIIAGREPIDIRLGHDSFEAKLKTLLDMLDVIQTKSSKIAYIDLNIKGKVVVKYES